MAYRYRRPGHRPGIRHAGRGGVVLALLGLGIVLTFLRSCLNLAIFDATTELERARARNEALVGEVADLKVEIDRLTAVARLQPLARQAGFVPVPAGAIRLVAVDGAPVSMGARPLPGAGALGRLMRQLASIAGVDEARAAHTPVTPATADGSGDAALVECGVNDRCEACRDAAALARRGPQTARSTGAAGVGRAP